MNLLIVSQNTNPNYLKDLQTNLQEQGHTVHLPYYVYDKNRILEVPGITAGNKTILSSSKLKEIVNKNQQEYYQQLLQQKGEDQLDAVLLYNPDPESFRITQEVQLPLLYALKEQMPIVTYQKSQAMYYMAGSLDINPESIYCIHGNLDLLNPKQKVKRK